MIAAYLGLGANLGDREVALNGARAALDQVSGLRVAAASSLYETAPIGGPPDQGDYLNAVVRVETRLSPRELLQACQAVENRFGRQRRQRWGPRTLDIDILFFGHHIMRQEDLIIPHPQLHLRSFVLVPLLELAPELEHPLLGQTIRQLHAGLSNHPGVRRLAENW